MKKYLSIFIILIGIIILSGCGEKKIDNSAVKQNTANKPNEITEELKSKITTIEGKFVVDDETIGLSTVNGIIVYGYNCQETPEWCLRSPKCPKGLNKEGCPYVGKNVKITGKLGKEDCIEGEECLNREKIDVESIDVIGE